MNCLIKDIELSIEEHAILPNYKNYYVDATPEFDAKWHEQKNDLNDIITGFLKVNPENDHEYFSLAPYHNDEYQFWIYIYDRSVLCVDFFNLLIALAKKYGCFYMMECNIPEEGENYYGQIAVSHSHIVFGSLSDDGKLPEISGILK